MFQLNKGNSGDALCLAIIVMAVFVLTACSSDSDTPNTGSIVERPTVVPIINSAIPFKGPLVIAGQQSVSRFIKNGIYSATFDYTARVADEVLPTTVNADVSFSTTNTQESGVDEADRIEYDGDILYLAAYPQWSGEKNTQDKVRILERQSDFSLSEVANLPVVYENTQIDGIYQQDDRLAVLSSSGQVYTLDILSSEPAPWTSSKQRVGVDIYDTSVASSPSVLSNIQIDGTMLSSRRINDDLFVVTSYTVYIEGLNTEATTDAELLANYLTILDTPDSQLMPKIYRDGNEGTPLNSIEDCAIPSQATENDGYAQLLTMVRINLTDVNNVSASCISSVAEMMYMSKDNLYLSASVNDQTVLHKVSLDTNLTYQASGSVDGVIGWRGAANLRLSEQNNILRIVTSNYSSGEPEHKLSILSQQDNALTTMATLPNDTYPEAIGKPGEDIFAVRFLGDRGYIVTFERIDPLYVIDLAEPNNPKILGALEIPGFSSYLHPLDNGFLLGVGQQVNIRNIPANGEAINDVPVTDEGMKISLFDVSDPTNPVEVNSIVKPSSYTPVEYDYRALSVLNNNGRYQFAVPVESWNESGDDLIAVWQPTNSLLLFEVDTTANAPALMQRSEVRPKTDELSHYVNGFDDRSVIDGNNVYYIHGNQVWHTTWTEGAEVFGPF
jgi:uncharacterized secreted protein with C-terminal beta-propeller domain